MTEENTFSNVFWGHSNGFLTLANGLLVWRSKNTEVLKKISKDEIVNILWAQLGKLCYVKIFMRGGKVVKFSGLKRKDIDIIVANADRELGRELKKEKVASSGGNWGDMVFEGPNLTFRDEDKTVLEIPLESISQCAVPSKNEVELQFHEDNTVDGNEETLVEMRLYVPPGGDEEPRCETFKTDVLERADISTVTGQAVVELDETIGTFLTPRGRYAIELYATFLRMHGKTYDYKIMYSNINRCFLLEKDGNHDAFVISLEEPIRQGKQGYPHLVLQLRRDEIHIDVNRSAEDLKQYDGNLAQRMSGLLPQMVATLFKFLIKKKVYTSGRYYNHNQGRSVKCALKAQEGYLYPLEKSFMFIHKPTTFIRYEEIDFIDFQRYSGHNGSSASRNFDLLVKCKSVGGEIGKEYLFSAIDRREFPSLSQFLSSKKIKIKQMKEEAVGTGITKRAYTEEGEVEDGEEDEEEDSDFGPGGSGSDDDFSDESLSGSGEDSEAGDSGEDEQDEEGTKKRKKSSSSKGKKKKRKSSE